MTARKPKPAKKAATAVRWQGEITYGDAREATCVDGVYLRVVPSGRHGECWTATTDAAVEGGIEATGFNLPTLEAAKAAALDLAKLVKRWGAKK